MKLRALLLLGVFGLSGSVFAEGGCPTGYTPANNGQNWTCIPGGNDAPAPQSQARPPRLTGYWEKTWGAIATDTAAGVLGLAVGVSSEIEAKHVAMLDCRNKGGGGCEVDLAYYNQCAVLVLGDTVFNTAHAASIEKASTLGLRQCQKSSDNCRVYYSACTEPIYHRY